MAFRLVAIDLYGTLVGPGARGDIPVKNRDACALALDHGVTIALVTGLNRGSALNVLETSGIEPRPGLLLVCFNGAVMFEPATGNVVWEYSLDSELVARLVSHSDIQPHFPMVHGPFDHRNLMWIQKGDYPPVLSRYLARRTEVLGDLSVRLTNNLADIVTFPVQEVSILGPEKTLFGAIDRLSKQFAGAIKVVKSLWKDQYAWLEILRPEAGKGEAVKRIKYRFNMNRNQIIAIGDNLNDVEMFREAGVSVAMGNAPQEVKHATTYVTDTWDQAGVAHAIRRWVLKD
jgi:Cof subfamily protein (haloacid dehalogenase superfamily)